MKANLALNLTRDPTTKWVVYPNWYVHCGWPTGPAVLPADPWDVTVQYAYVGNFAMRGGDQVLGRCGPRSCCVVSCMHRSRVLWCNDVGIPLIFELVWIVLNR